jgi:hypothetical protein
MNSLSLVFVRGDTMDDKPLKADGEESWLGCFVYLMCVKGKASRTSLRQGVNCCIAFALLCDACVPL